VSVSGTSPIKRRCRTKAEHVELDWAIAEIFFAQRMRRHRESTAPAEATSLPNVHTARWRGDHAYGDFMSNDP
jgi:hypothetical protein